jgi:DNA-binding CsgD family transcriptional regulator
MIAGSTSFTQLLHNIMLVADELPTPLIIHETETMDIIYMNKIGLDGLDATLEEIQGINTKQYHIRFFNSDDSDDYVPKVLMVIKGETDQPVSYFQQVRKPGDKEWRLYASNTKVFARDDSGKVTHMITIAALIDPVHHINAKISRLMDDVSFFRENNSLFLKLTKREREVLKYMAEGMNSGEISDKLFISITTADTHRKNIRKKLGLKNTYDPVKFAQAYNLI